MNNANFNEFDRPARVEGWSFIRPADSRPKDLM